ncbi:hypothetical protein RLDS_25880 [Sphingobium lactosutens DS20]|uniref:Uncharacterized protein n=1 Tax=Sphingobium lactosutens DS20 TaxID=1331060 RepID=T0IGS1_9SPHN|nr:hypothetical protein RLDS_25880 [Sphingobium lactosutens DS20]
MSSCARSTAANTDDAKAIIDDNGGGIKLLITNVEMLGAKNGYGHTR